VAAANSGHRSGDVLAGHLHHPVRAHRLQTRSVALPVLALVDDQHPVVGVRRGERWPLELRGHPRPVHVGDQPDRFPRGAVHQVEQAVLVGDPPVKFLDHPGDVLRVRGQRPDERRRHLQLRTVRWWVDSVVIGVRRIVRHDGLPLTGRAAHDVHGIRCR
jgi:hypothetical protein